MLVTYHNNEITTLKATVCEALLKNLHTTMACWPASFHFPMQTEKKPVYFDPYIYAKATKNL